MVFILETIPMSAIAGLYQENVRSINHLGFQMMQALKKFPADDVQIWRGENIYFGCHSQWITPESIGEPLPFYDYERDLAITSDAILDNRMELFERLNIDKSVRNTMPDSQLILLAYAKWDDQVPKYLMGDFAFMIWDGKRRKLFGARDFSGARTLYFYNKNQRFAFCSVMEPLFSMPYVVKDLNEEWLSEFLAIPDLIDSINASITVIKDVQQVPPSHSITVTEGVASLAKYQVIETDKKIRFQKDEDYVEAFRDIYQKAVDSRIRTFRAVGAQLSGGLDSGSVVSFAARSLQKEKKRLYTYSYIPEDDFEDWTPRNSMANESSFINSTILQVGNIEKKILSFVGENSYSNIDEWLEIMEMPYKFFENSFWIKGIYEKASEQDVGILLSGGRGNFTVSWGPAFSYYSTLLKRLKWFRLNREVQVFKKNIGMKRLDVYSIIFKEAFPFLQKSDEYQFPKLINPDFANRTKVFDRLQEYGIGPKGFPKIGIDEARQYHFEKEFIWNSSGTTNSKLSLQYGLWNRDPTNDIRVINYCLAIPLDQFVNKGMNRALIRRATEGMLPENVRLNHRIYGVQAADWVHRMTKNWSLFMNEVNQLVKDPIAAEYMDTEILKSILPKVMRGTQANQAFDPNLRILMRSLIVYRFLQSLFRKGGEINEKTMEAASFGSTRY